MNKRLVVLSAFALLLLSGICHAQIFGPEGMNIPGAFNGWSNPPSVNAFAGIQKSGGTFLLDSLLQLKMYRTNVHVAPTGGDAVAGTYVYLFTSGPVGNHYQNKWNQVSTVLDSVQTYTYATTGGSDNSITLTNNRYYTVNVADNGYASTQAIWIETASPPVQILSVNQTPSGATVPPSTAVTVSIKTSSSPSAFENFYVRYSTDNFVTSTLAPATFVASDSATAGLPAFTGGETVRYYAFSTKATDPVSNVELQTLRYDAGPTKKGYSYAVFAPLLTITATAGPHGSISPSGDVTVASGGNQSFTITPDPGYFISGVLVDNVFAGTSGTYDFTNVISNHTIEAYFSKNVNVTFQVDMRVMCDAGLFVPASDSVWVRGTFNGWGTTLLADANSDSVYAATVAIEQNTPIEYKFFKSLRGGLEWEDHVSNRQVSLGSNDTTLGVVYFDNQNPEYDVTFQVDMRASMAKGNFRPDLGDVATVRGSFNDWGNSTNNPDTLADPDLDSIYVRTIAITGGQEISYKFWKTLRGGFEYEAGENRSYSHGLQAEVIPVTLFKESFVAFSVSNRWNLISVPVQTDKYARGVLFPTATSAAFAYAGGYVQRDTLTPGLGYWLKFGSAQALELSGEPITAESLDVSDGWNLIGCAGVAVPVAAVRSNPPGLLTSPFYAYQSGYTTAVSLDPGRGYWVKAGGAGVVIIDTTSGSLPDRAGGLHEVLPSVKITDAEGYGQTLHVAPEGMQIDPSELPPMPPEGVFDVRYGSGLATEVVPPEGREIRISSAVDPVTLEWSGMPVHGYAIHAGDAVIAMSGSGRAMLPDKSRKVTIVHTEGGGVVRDYALEQNYPNPFNPSTVVTFRLPAASYVTVKVFNVLGQEVASLADGLFGEGRHEVGFTAGGSSGMLLLRLHAYDPVEMREVFSMDRKMVILK